MEVSYNHKNISWNCKLSPHFPHSDPYTPVFSQSKGDRALPGSVSPDPTILPSCPHNTHNCQSLVSAQLSPHFRILGLALYCLVVTQTFLLLHPLTWHDSGHERKFDIWLFTKNITLKWPSVLADYRAPTELSPKNVEVSDICKKFSPSWGNKQMLTPSSPQYTTSWYWMLSQVNNASEI